MKFLKTLPVLFFLTVGFLRAQSGTIDLKSHGALDIFLEERWTVSVSEFDRVIVKIVPKDETTNADMELTITFPEQDRFAQKAKLRSQVELNGRRFELGSVEGKSIARELNSSAGGGYYCNFTDPELVGKPPQKGNFKTISIGMIRVAPDVLIEFAIQADGFRDKAYQELLGALEGMEYKPRRGAR